QRRGYGPCWPSPGSPGRSTEAHEQRLATAGGSQALELLVPRGGRRALARPPLAERRQRTEQLLRVARIRADVVVPEHDGTGRAVRDLAHDLVDRTVAHGARPVQERDRAVVAPVRAAAGRE